MMQHQLIDTPSKVKACGNLDKIILEYVGKVNTNEEKISFAVMNSPKGWKEPGQLAQFDEYTYVQSGTLKIETKEKTFNLKKGELFIAKKDLWVRYSSPEENTSYISVCIPAFGPELCIRDDS